MSVYITAFTEKGISVGKKLASRFNGTLSVPQRFSKNNENPTYDSLNQWVKTIFFQGNYLIFIGACGIAVRSIAPYIADKFSDPAVIVVDEFGKVVIPLLSGHIGGANQLTIEIASFLGGIPAISTATDLNHRISIDLWAKKYHLRLSDRILAKEVSASVLEGNDIHLTSDFPISFSLPEGMKDYGEGIPVKITKKNKPKNILRLIPPILYLGIGCRRGKTENEIHSVVSTVLDKAELDEKAIVAVASIDLKKDEIGLIDYCNLRNIPFLTYSANELNEMTGQFTPSDFVTQITGVDNICERSAITAIAGNGTLIVKKQSNNGITVAVAQKKYKIQETTS